MKSIIIAVMLLFILSPVVSGKGIQDRFAGAEEAYKAGNYQEAIDVYLYLYNDGLRSAELFYNLGCAYYKAGSLGLSRAYFMIARLYKPSDSDIDHNLNIIKNEIKDSFQDGGSNFLSEFYNSIVISFTFRLWSYTFFSVLTLFWIFTCLYFLLYYKRLMIFRILIFVCLILSLILFPFFRSSYILYNNPSVGIIIADSTSLRNGPDYGMVSLATINDGTAVMISDERNDFFRIMLPNGIVGWVQRDKIFIIEPDYLR